MIKYDADGLVNINKLEQLIIPVKVTDETKDEDKIAAALARVVGDAFMAGHSTVETDEEVTAFLDMWSVREHHRNPAASVLQGLVYRDNKKRFHDGQFINTSVFMLDEYIPKEGMIIKTIFSSYLLGKSEKDYLEEVDAALNRR